MPRNRRPPDLAEAFVYARARRKKLKGPRKAIYELIEGALLNEMLRHERLGGATGDVLSLCEACATKVKDHPHPLH